jgi:hypothetical protein
MIFGTVFSEYPLSSTRHMVLTSNGEVISIDISVQQVVNVTLNLYEK